MGRKTTGGLRFEPISRSGGEVGPEASAAPRPDVVEGPTGSPHHGQIASAVAPLVLVVDDHADSRDAFAEYLRLSGFRTAQAENGVLAIRAARELKPDAILLDHAMPIMNGLQAATFLKRDAATRAIPIVMVTAFGEEVRGRAPCDGYLEKPCDPRDVVHKLWSLLPGSQPK